MKTPEQLYQERLTRIMEAVSLGNPDRVPLVPLADSFCARHMGVKIGAFGTDSALSSDTVLKSWTALGEVDGIQHVGLIAPLLSSIWYSKVKVFEDDLWQVMEGELMTIADYDFIIKNGFNAFQADFYQNRLDNLGPKVGAFISNMPRALQGAKDLGIVPFSPMIFTIPFEMFCGGRSFVKFLGDLRQIPEKVQEAMDAAMPEIIAGAKGAIQAFKPTGVWVGGWRAASEFIGPKLWEKFVFPYFKQLTEAVIEAGAVAVLHMDSSWERDLDHFLELPKAKCVFSPDGSTDIFKAKKVLGDHMCIMGDVPATMLAIATPGEVEAYCTRLIRELGPKGFILAQGCDIPTNAKPENIRAMITAAMGH